MQILVAGPYRSGTDDKPELIQKNISQMEQVAWEVYKRGHLPILGEWVALPLIKEAGSRNMGDDIWDKLFHPVAIRLIEKCDAVLRIGGASTGADEMVRIGLEKEKIIYYSIQQVPGNAKT